MTTTITLPKWTRPANYMGANWPGFYVFLGRHRDSNALDRANFNAGLKAVREVASKDSIPGDDESPTVQVVSENHRLVGWVEWIAIHESDVEALRVALEIMNSLENYPVVDEELFSQYESDEANEVWKNCHAQSDRVEYIRKHKSQFEFRSLTDLLGCVRGNYFAGYASELLG